MHGVWPVFLVVLTWPLWAERPYSVSWCPWSLRKSEVGFTANSEQKNILLNIFVIAGWKVEPNGCLILHKACHLVIGMQLKGNFEYGNKWCGEVFCIKFVGSLCILKVFFFGGGGTFNIQKILEEILSRHYWGMWVPLLGVVVPNKILLLRKEMEIQNNCIFKPGVCTLLLIRCTCKSEYTHRPSAVDSNSLCFHYNWLLFKNILWLLLLLCWTHMLEMS